MIVSGVHPQRPVCVSSASCLFAMSWCTMLAVVSRLGLLQDAESHSAPSLWKGELLKGVYCYYERRGLLRSEQWRNKLRFWPLFLQRKLVDLHTPPHTESRRQTGGKLERPISRTSPLSRARYRVPDDSMDRPPDRTIAAGCEQGLLHSKSPSKRTPARDAWCTLGQTAGQKQTTHQGPLKTHLVPSGV